MPPTEYNLRKLDQQAKGGNNNATRIRANIPGSSIMDSILHNVKGGPDPASSAFPKKTP